MAWSEVNTKILIGDCRDVLRTMPDLQRKSIMIELNEAYVKMATRRIKRDAGLFADVDIG